MMTMLGLVASFLTLSSTAAASLSVQSAAGRSILQNARSLNNNQDVNFDFIADYSIKFQGCHHVSQWNSDANEENDVRIKTKRLVRFRLCPSNSCQSERSAGCTTKFGDYVVDLNTFVAAYLNNLANEMDDLCNDTMYACKNECNGGNDEDCMTACYEDYGMSACLNEDGGDAQNNDGGFDVTNYAECAQFQFGNQQRRRMEDAGNDDGNAQQQDDDNNEYYIGPFCADQGGEIHLGLFSDDTCTTFVNNGDSLFYTKQGYALPYSDNTLISTRCLTCARHDENGNSDIKELCSNTYDVSGKCETKMSVDYPNESACTYIEGIKIIRSDGVIRTSSVRKSKAAAVAIGLLLTVAVLLAGYVYYLRTSKSKQRLQYVLCLKVSNHRDALFQNLDVPRLTLPQLPTRCLPKSAEQEWCVFLSIKIPKTKTQVFD
jgi:hypothetical protein